MRLLLCVLVVGFVACGNDDSASLTTDEERYVEFIRERIPESAHKTDAELISGGKKLCNQLEGKTTNDLGRLAVILGYDMQEFADVLVASVNTFCPEYDHLLNE